ncbi:spermine synthase [candidate division WOR-3 bacterium]|nr:spermine synthase [candidate division WOR-3 bacterium]
MKTRTISAILTMGFSGIVAQVLLLRELLITFQGNELSIGIILANWLILEAFGAFFLGKKIENRKYKIEVFVAFQLLFSLSFPVAIYLSRTLKGIIGVTSGEALGILPMFFSSFFILLFVSISHGALFTFGCSIYDSVDKGSKGATSIGKVYIYETIGTLIGGILFTYLLIPYFHSVKIALGIALLNLIMCPILLGQFWRNAQIVTKILGFISAVLLLLLCLILCTNGADIIQRLSVAKQWRGQNVLHYENSIYGNVVVTEREEQYTFFSDGIPVITTPTPDISFTEEFVHLPMLYHPKPKEILIISGGAGGIINEVLKYPIERIDYVELDPLILEMVKRYSTPLTDTELASPRLKIHYLDGRYFTINTLNKYDLIMIGLSNPQDLQVNRFFTREFFLLAKSRLKQEGILVINLPGSLTYLGEELKNLNRCILNTLKNVFLYIKIIPGDGANLYLASQSKEISLINDKELIQRLNKRGIKVNLLTPPYIEYKLHPRWIEWFLSSLEQSTDRINKDFHPLGVFYSLSYWNALFSPNLRGLFRYFERTSLQIFIIFLIVFTLLFLSIRIKIKGISKSSITICIITTGFAGMLFDLILIFAFQILYGYVFYWIGIIVTALMVGVAVGGQIATSLLERIKKHFMLFSGIELSIIGFSIVLPLIFLKADFSSSGPVLFLLLSFFSGLLIGLEFPLANKIYLSINSKQEFRGTAGLLYGADLFGGWLGGILGGVVLLPVLGLLGTCVVVFMFKLSSFIILISSASTFRKMISLK